MPAWRQLLRARSLRYGTNAVVLTAAVAAIIVFLNILAGQWRLRWDLTASKEFTLAPQTTALLRDLKQPIKAYAFVQEGYEGERIKSLLQEYSLQSDRFRYETVDPNKNPGLAQKYDVTMFNTVVFESGDQTRKVYSFDIFGYSSETGGQQFQGEQAFTRAIREVTEGTAGKVYFLTAHGERNLNVEYQSVRGYVEGEGYTVEELNIAEKGGVPADASVVVLAGPQRDYAKPELDALNLYLDRGGRLMVLLDPPGTGQPLAALEKWVAGWGLQVQRDVIADPESHYFVDPLSLIPEWEYHETTKQLMSERVGIVVPRARSLTETGQRPTGYAATRLLKTSEAAWGEVNFTAERFRRDASDHAGPLALAYAIEPAAAGESADGAGGDGAGAGKAGPKARLFVMGSSAWSVNDVLNFQGNLDFFVNAINWLAGKEEMITIRPKAPEQRRVQLSGTSAAAVFYGTVAFVPLAVLLAGGAVWWRRRRL